MSPQSTARSAGALYLVAVITGVLVLMYLPGKLLVPGNAAATAARLLGSGSLTTLYIVSGVVSMTSFLFAVLMLYVLLKDVGRQAAGLMVLLLAVQIPVGIHDIQNQLTALDLLRGGGVWAAFGQSEREALAMLYLDVHKSGVPPLALFWGLWLFPLGWLVFRSGFLPRFLGVWLVLNGLAYVVYSFTGMMAPSYLKLVQQVTIPALLGELALTLWLLIRGVKPMHSAGEAAAPRL